MARNGLWPISPAALASQGNAVGHQARRGRPDGGVDGAHRGGLQHDALSPHRAGGIARPRLLRKPISRVGLIETGCAATCRRRPTSCAELIMSSCRRADDMPLRLLYAFIRQQDLADRRPTRLQKAASSMKCSPATFAAVARPANCGLRFHAPGSEGRQSILVVLMRVTSSCQGLGIGRQWRPAARRLQRPGVGQGDHRFLHWKRARAAWKPKSRDIALFQARQAEAVGLTYEEYTAGTARAAAGVQQEDVARIAEIKGKRRQPRLSLICSCGSARAVFRPCRIPDGVNVTISRQRILRLRDEPVT